MKIKIILAGILMVFFASCSEDFLDLPSPSSLTTDTYFQTEDDFEAAVNGIYTDLRDFHGFNNILIGDMHSENTRYFYNPELRAWIANEYASDFAYQYTTFSSFWTTFYSWISRANQVISLIDDVDFSDATVRDNLKGQALFIRAYAYWWLVRVYGQAVIHTEPVTTLEETSKALSSETEVVAQVISDATAAAGMLLDKSTQEAGRVTKGSAYMLLADLHMFYEEWAQAETALKSITGYSLMANFGDVFDVNQKNNAESIFEIQYIDPDYTCGYMYGVIPKPMETDAVYALTGTSNAQELSGNAWCAPTPDFMAKWEAGDSLRFNETIQYVDYNYGTNVPMNAKYLHKHSLHNQPLNNFIVWRYAEVLLYLAEAINEQNRPAEALPYLNQIRSRAGLPDETTTDQSALRDAIRHEREIELAFEGKRWFDLVRYGTYEEVITAYGANVLADPAAYYFTPGTAPVAGSFQDFRTVFNMPIDETSYNTEIE